MSKLKVSLCALALTMAASTAYADDAVTQGTVTFNGELIADTCSIVSGDENLTVTLPTLSTQTLANAGDTAGSKTFDIRVENCPTTGTGIPTQVAAHFEAINSDGFNATTKNLTNSATTTPASNVEVRLFDKDGTTVLPVGDTGGYFPITAGTATMTYIGAYYATAATTAGKVSARVQYTLAYK
ncbi:MULTISPECIES: fimbrial protein [Enterobacterales]|uniref:fimbrial protein n=1 Tax=Enterobacterales TaxID=91347 RepID=UPI002ED79698